MLANVVKKLRVYRDDFGTPKRKSVRMASFILPIEIVLDGSSLSVVLTTHP